MNRSKALAAMSALSHGDRLDLVRLLVPEGNTGLTAGEIARRMGMAASRLSFHLSQLEAAGLISSRREARHIFYAVVAPHLGATIAYLMNDCCQESPEVMACCFQRKAGQEASPGGEAAGEDCGKLAAPAWAPEVLGEAEGDPEDET